MATYPVDKTLHHVRSIALARMNSTVDENQTLIFESVVFFEL